MKRKIKHAIIGTSGIANKHFKGYLAIPDDVEIVAICDIDEEKLAAAQKKYSIKTATKNYQELFDGEVDSVSICLPNHLHAPVSIEALKAGLHVHCEKPMAMNGNEAVQMLEASKQNEKTLMIALNNRFTPHAQYVKNLALSGWFGDMYFAKCGWVRRSGLPYRSWYGEKKYAGGGALIDLGVHFIDLTLYVMDYPDVHSVAARTYSKFGGTSVSPVYAFQNMPIEPDFKFDVDDLAAGMVFMKNGASLQFEISWASNIEKEYFFYDIYGDKGGMSFRFNVDEDTVPTLKLFNLMNGQLADTTPMINANAFPTNEFSHFVDCVRSGKTSTMAPPEQSVTMMKIVDGIYESSRTGNQIMF